MTALFFAWGLALWLGILTTLSPCPLATNVAAISFLAQGAPSRGAMFARGGAYVIGRVAATVLLGWLVVEGLSAVPGLSLSLQKNINKLLGPLLLFAGVFLLDLVPLKFPWTGKRELGAGSRSVGGAFVLGGFLGLALCPEGAAIFFGALIPLAVRHDSSFLLPLLYGLGTGLPIAALAAAARFGVAALTGALLSAEALERGFRLVTGGIFVAVGLFFIFTHVFPLL